MKGTPKKTERNQSLVRDYIENVVPGVKTVNQSIETIAGEFNEDNMSEGRYYQILRAEGITIRQRGGGS